MNLQRRRAVKTDKQTISDVGIAAFADEQEQEIADPIADLLEDPNGGMKIDLGTFRNELRV